MAIVRFVDDRFADYRYDTQTREVISMKRSIPIYMTWCNDERCSRYVMLISCKQFNEKSKMIRISQSEIEYCHLVTSPFKRTFDI